MTKIYQLYSTGAADTKHDIQIHIMDIHTYTTQHIILILLEHTQNATTIRQCVYTSSK